MEITKCENNVQNLLMRIYEKMCTTVNYYLIWDIADTFIHSHYPIGTFFHFSSYLVIELTPPPPPRTHLLLASLIARPPYVKT